MVKGHPRAGYVSRGHTRRAYHKRAFSHLRQGFARIQAKEEPERDEEKAFRVRDPAVRQSEDEELSVFEDPDDQVEQIRL